MNKKQKKETIVNELSQKAQKAKGLVFTNYQGMTHKQLENLKKELKKTEAELVVTKNTLLKLSLSTFNSQSASWRTTLNFEQPTATLFIYNDIIAALKALAKSIKNLKLPLIKSGIIDGKILGEADIVLLSTLPSREALIAQVVNGIKSPLFGLHRALSWNIQKLVLTLKAIEKSRMSS